MAHATRRRVWLVLPALLLVTCRSAQDDADTDVTEEERLRASGLRSLERQQGKGKIPDINVRRRETLARAPAIARARSSPATHTRCPTPRWQAQFRGTERRPAGAAGSDASVEMTSAKEEAAIEAGGENREQGNMPYTADADSPYVDPDHVVPDAEPPSWIHEPTWWWLTPPWWIVTPPLWSEAARNPDASDQGVWMGEGARPSADVSFLQLMSQIDSLGVLEMPED